MALPDRFQTILDDYTCITVQKHTDSQSRRFYFFEDRAGKTLTVIVFSIPMHTFVSLNNIVIPMADFYTIKNMYTKENPLFRYNRVMRGDEETQQSIMNTAAGIICDLQNGDTFSVPNTTIPLLCMAITTLSAEDPPIEIRSPFDLDVGPITLPDDLFGEPNEKESTEEYVGPLRRFWRWLW